MYRHLFSEGRIGTLNIKNRIIMTAAGCELALGDGSITESYIAYYEARAKGGVGAIISELVQVNSETGVMNLNQIRMQNESCIEQLRPMIQRIHSHNCKFFLQLQHPGNVAIPRNINGNTPVSSSHLSNLSFEQEVRPLTVQEIHALTEDFGDAAYRAKCAYADGVEIHAAHFYLIHQFLSPYFNKRKDLYGGSHENRMRFLKEIIENVRKKCGDDFPIIVRISVEEYLPSGGYHLDEGIKICQDLESYGVDALDITVAGSGCPGGQSVEPISFSQGWRKHLPAAIKAFVKIPVIGVVLVREPEFAEQLLAENTVDFVGSARAHIADPEWSNKAAEGRSVEIRRCISCLSCIQSVSKGNGILCALNAECGYEAEEQILVQEHRKEKILIIGAGPAGLEAARIAAIRGFSVTIWEAQKYIGGQLYLAARVPFQNKINWVIDFYKNELTKLHVNIIYNKKATEKEIYDENPYAVILQLGLLQ